MEILLFLFWIVLNGRITTEIVVTGIVLVALIYLGMHQFLNYSMTMEVRILKKVPLILAYLWCLFVEIVKANLIMIRFVLGFDLIPEPELVHIEIGLKTSAARMILANSITLTPGTITVDMEGNIFTVHCFDKSMAEGLSECKFVRLLERLEA